MSALTAALLIIAIFVVCGIWSLQFLAKVGMTRAVPFVEQAKGQCKTALSIEDNITNDVAGDFDSDSLIKDTLGAEPLAGHEPSGSVSAVRTEEPDSNTGTLEEHDAITSHGGEAQHDAGSVSGGSDGTPEADVTIPNVPATTPTLALPAPVEGEQGSGQSGGLS